MTWATRRSHYSSSLPLVLDLLCTEHWIGLSKGFPQSMLTGKQWVGGERPGLLKEALPRNCFLDQYIDWLTASGCHSVMHLHAAVLGHKRACPLILKWREIGRSFEHTKHWGQSEETSLSKCADSWARALPLDSYPHPGFMYKLHAHPADFFNKNHHPNHNVNSCLHYELSV